MTHDIVTKTVDIEELSRVAQETKLKEEAEMRGKAKAVVSSEILAAIEAEAILLANEGSCCS